VNAGWYIQYTDTQTYVRTLQLILMVSPIELVFSSTSMEPRESKLVRTVRNFVAADIPIIAVARRFFNDAAGTPRIGGRAQHQ